MLSQKDFFLSIVRLGIGNTTMLQVPEEVDWNGLETLAADQGLFAVLVDGVEKFPESKRPPKPVLLKWIGETLQGYEYRYELYLRTIAEMAAFYNEHGFKMMVLKGYACSLYWPKPEHRPCGDIDIWLFGQQKEADGTLEEWFKSSKVQGFKIDRSHHHHTVFEWEGFTVENHYDFINIHARKTNKELEQLFKSLADDDTCSVDLLNQKVYLPTANLHVLFLIRHLVAHFSSERLTIRQLLDWAFFVKNHYSEIDWAWLEGTLEQFGMMRFYKTINAICVSDLGFDVKLFPCVQFDPFMKERVLNDILSPEFSGKEPKRIWKRVPFKYRRWKSNGWKRELCFNESSGSAFWSGVKSHLMKPASI